MTHCYMTFPSASRSFLQLKPLPQLDTIKTECVPIGFHSSQSSLTLTATVQPS